MSFGLSVFRVSTAGGSSSFRLKALMIEILLNQEPPHVNRNSINCQTKVVWDRPLITTRQVKAARALLGWSQADLANRSGVSEPTIARLESMDGWLGGRKGTAQKIQTAIVSAGIEFLDENGGGAGVRLRKRRPRKGSKGD